MKLKLILAALAAAGLGANAHAQDPPPIPEDLLPPVLEARDWGAKISINQIEISKFPEVTIYATVTQAEQPLTGLTAKDFRVREDEFVQAPLHVEAKRDPLSVVVLIDVSGSMKDAMEAVQDAAAAFLGTLSEEDSVLVMTFHEQIDTIYDLGSDFEAAEAAIRKTRHRGDTALYDGINAALVALESVEGRRAVIALSDGVDDDGRGKQLSKNNLDVPLMRALTSSIPVYTIGLGTKMDEGVLKTFGSATGAAYLQAPTTDELQELYDDLGQQLAGQYAIRYTSRSPGDGSIRHVKVDYVVPSAKPYAAPVPVQLDGDDNVVEYEAPQLSKAQQSKLAYLSGVGELKKRYDLPGLDDLNLEEPAAVGWPAWLPAYPEVLSVSPVKIEGMVDTLEFTTTDKGAKVTGTYEALLSEDGWAIDAKVDVGPVSTLQTNREEAKLSVAAVDEEEKTKVTATHEGGATTPIIVNVSSTAHVVAAHGRDVLITGGFAQVQVTGPCGELTISGPGNDVRAAQVENVVVSGPKNLISITQLTSGKLTGDGNRLMWKEAGEDAQEPKLVDLGEENTVMKQLE